MIEHMTEHGGLLMSALLKSLMTLLMSSTFNVLKLRLLLLFETFSIQIIFVSLFLYGTLPIDVESGKTQKIKV